MQNLSAQQIDDLSKKLIETLDFSDLERFVHISTGEPLYEYWVKSDTLFIMIQNLLVKLQKHGLLIPFLRKVYIERPFKGDVRDLIAVTCPEAAVMTTLISTYVVQKNGAVDEDSPPPGSFIPGLQRNIKPHLHQLDILKWVAGLMNAERRTCRVELSGGAAGSGFLVGPEAVLTNWHVVEAAHKAGRMRDLACRFDYALQSDGTINMGFVVPFQGDGLVHHREYAPAEMTETPETPPPTTTELDFALLHLSRPIGTELVDGGAQRGWIALPTSIEALTIGSPLIIVQHPDGGPIKMAIDTEAIMPLPEPRDRPRIRYATNTEPGSSGSPCFTMDWDLVALHHFGDPAWRAPKFNQGIPAALIHADIKAANHGCLLGGPLRL